MRGPGRTYAPTSLSVRVALANVRPLQPNAENATGARPSAGAVSGTLRNITGCRLDAGTHHFDRRIGLAGALRSRVGICLSREAMTKPQMSKVVPAVKRPRAQAVPLQ